MPIIPSKVESPEIATRNVLLVEGNDEFNFFMELLGHMGMNTDIDVQPRTVGGKDNFKYALPAFLNDPNFPRVTAYAIIRDADTNAKAALASIQKVLRDNGQPCPRQHGEFACFDALKVGVFILPGNTNRGMLEDLCLSSVREHPIMPYVDEYIEQVKSTMRAKSPKNEGKAKLQVFLAGMPKTDERLGIAAKWKYWPFDHEAFASICDFIEELIRPFSTVHPPNLITRS
jgi:hypothetical protein